jgi:hypothetical protein
MAPVDVNSSAILWQLAQYVDQYTTESAVPFSLEKFPLHPGVPIERLEEAHKIGELYIWLSYELSFQLHLFLPLLFFSCFSVPYHSHHFIFCSYVFGLFADIDSLHFMNVPKQKMLSTKSMNSSKSLLKNKVNVQNTL